MNKSPRYIWRHRNAESEVIGEIHRFVDDQGGKKDLPYYTPNGNGGFTAGIPATLKPYPLIGLNSIKDVTKPVYIVEGQKCQQAMVTIGYQCVTSILGANSAAQSDWSPLKDCKVIYLMPDADAAGDHYVQSIYTILHKQSGNTVKISLLNTDEAGKAIVGLGWGSGDDIVDIVQSRAEKWNGFKSLKKHPDKKLLRKMVNKLFKKYRRKIPSEWQIVDKWDYPDMSVSKTETVVPPVFPLDILGDFWATFVKELAKGSSAPVDFPAVILLAFVSAMIGNARWVKPRAGWSEPPVLWVAMIGYPGDAKSPAIKALLPYVAFIEEELTAEYNLALENWKTDCAQIQAQLALWETKTEKRLAKGKNQTAKPDSELPIKPVLGMFMLNDTTPEALCKVLARMPKGVLCLRDELAGLLGSFGRYSGSDADKSFWLECHGGGPFTVLRVKDHENPVKIPRLSVPILGGTQPDKLPSILLSGDNDGFAARFLYVWPESVPFEDTCDEFGSRGKAIEAFGQLFKLSLETGENDQLKPIEVPFSRKAFLKLINWVKRMAPEFRQHTGVLSGHVGKYRGFAVRLALVLSYLEWAENAHNPEPRQIKLKTAKAAMRLMEEYFLPMAKRSFADAGIPVTQRNAATLARWIIANKPKRINARAIYREAKLPGLKESAPVHAALNELVEAGWVRPLLHRAGGTHGRKSSDFEVNQLLFAK